MYLEPVPGDFAHRKINEEDGTSYCCLCGEDMTFGYLMVCSFRMKLWRERLHGKEDVPSSQT